MWPDDAKLILRKSTKFQTIHSSIVSSQHEDERTDSDTLGCVIFGGKLGWVANNAYLEVITVDSGNRIAVFDFDRILGTNDTYISCVSEIYIPGVRSCCLAVGLQLAPNGGKICIVSVQGSCVLGLIDFFDKVTTCHFVPKRQSDHSLRSLLRCFDGCLAVGTDTGKIILLDLCLKRCKYVIDGLLSSDDNLETQQCHIIFANVDPEEIMEHHDQSKQEDIYFGIQLEVLENAGHVQSIVVIPFSMTLVVGLDDGRMVLYDLENLQAFHLAYPPEKFAPLLYLSYLEPADDPRACIYVWALHSSPNGGIGVMHSIMFQHKYIDKTETVYRNFLSCSARLTMPMFDKNSCPIACHSITKLIDEEEEQQLTLCAISWITNTSCTLMVFDLNQWYKEQMPEVGDWRAFSTYTAIFPLGEICPLDIWLDEDLIVPFNSIQRPEEHFYPNSLSFDVIILTKTSILNTNWPGYQKLVLDKLVKAGSQAILEPHSYVREMIDAALTPQFMDFNVNLPMGIDLKREFLLTIALEYNYVTFLKKVAFAIADGSHIGNVPTEALGLSTVTDWIWNRARSLKDMSNNYCVPLFDYSGRTIDCGMQKSLTLCTRQLRVVANLMDLICTKCQEFIPEHVHKILLSQLESIQLASDYQEATQWLLNVGLLPEGVWRSDSHVASQPDEPIFVPYPFHLINSFYATQRMKLSHNVTNVSPDMPSPFIYIDTFIEQSCDMQAITELWKEHGGSGLYPPGSLQEMLRILLIPDIPIEIKHILFVYLFMDINHVLSEGRYGPVVQNLIKFPAVFKMDPAVIKVTQSFWYLDHGDLDTAIEELISPLSQSHNLKQWQRDFLITTLLKQESPHLALRILKAPGVPVDSTLELKTLLSNDLVCEAFTFQRAKGDKNLLMQFYEGIMKIQKRDLLLNLSLNEEESKTLIEFLENSKISLTENLHFVYLLQRSEFVDAVSLVDKLMKHARDKNYDLNVPREILTIYHTTLEPTSRQLTYLAYSHPDKFELKKFKEVPKPLSSSLIRQKLDPAAGVYQRTILSVKEAGNREMYEDDAKHERKLPFLRRSGLGTFSFVQTTQTSHVVYPVLVNRQEKKRQLEDKEKDAIEFNEYEGPRKRRKFDESEVPRKSLKDYDVSILTRFNPKLKPKFNFTEGNESMHFGAAANERTPEKSETTSSISPSTLLRTPVVEKAHRDESPERHRFTPQSILKSASHASLPRSITPLSYVSRKSFESEEKSIRFAIPGSNDTTLNSSTLQISSQTLNTTQDKTFDESIVSKDEFFSPDSSIVADESLNQSKERVEDPIMSLDDTEQQISPQEKSEEKMDVTEGHEDLSFLADAPQPRPPIRSFSEGSHSGSPKSTRSHSRSVSPGIQSSSIVTRSKSREIDQEIETKQETSVVTPQKSTTDENDDDIKIFDSDKASTPIVSLSQKRSQKSLGRAVLEKNLKQQLMSDIFGEYSKASTSQTEQEMNLLESSPNVTETDTSDVDFLSYQQSGILTGDTLVDQEILKKMLGNESMCSSYGEVTLGDSTMRLLNASSTILSDSSNYEDSRENFSVSDVKETSGVTEEVQKTREEQVETVAEVQPIQTFESEPKEKKTETKVEEVSPEKCEVETKEPSVTPHKSSEAITIADSEESEAEEEYYDDTEYDSEESVDKFANISDAEEEHEHIDEEVEDEYFDEEEEDMAEEPPESDVSRESSYSSNDSLPPTPPPKSQPANDEVISIGSSSDDDENDDKHFEEIAHNISSEPEIAPISSAESISRVVDSEFTSPQMEPTTLNQGIIMSHMETSHDIPETSYQQLTNVTQPHIYYNIDEPLVEPETVSIMNEEEMSNLLYGEVEVGNEEKPEMKTDVLNVAVIDEKSHPEVYSQSTQESDKLVIVEESETDQPEPDQPEIDQPEPNQSSQETSDEPKPTEETVDAQKVSKVKTQVIEIKESGNTRFEVVKEIYDETMVQPNICEEELEIIDEETPEIVAQVEEPISEAKEEEIDIETNPEPAQETGEETEKMNEKPAEDFIVAEDDQNQSLEIPEEMAADMETENIPKEEEFEPKISDVEQEDVKVNEPVISVQNVNEDEDMTEQSVPAEVSTENVEEQPKTMSQEHEKSIEEPQKLIEEPEKMIPEPEEAPVEPETEETEAELPKIIEESEKIQVESIQEVIEQEPTQSTREEIQEENPAFVEEEQEVVLSQESPEKPVEETVTSTEAQPVETLIEVKTEPQPSTSRDKRKSIYPEDPLDKTSLYPVPDDGVDLDILDKSDIYEETDTTTPLVRTLRSRCKSVDQAPSALDSPFVKRSLRASSVPKSHETPKSLKKSRRISVDTQLKLENIEEDAALDTITTPKRRTLVVTPTTETPAMLTRSASRRLSTEFKQETSTPSRNTRASSKEVSSSRIRTRRMTDNVEEENTEDTPVRKSRRISLSSRKSEEPDDNKSEISVQSTRSTRRNLRKIIESEAESTSKEEIPKTRKTRSRVTSVSSSDTSPILDEGLETYSQTRRLTRHQRAVLEKSMELSQQASTSSLPATLNSAKNSDAEISDTESVTSVKSTASTKSKKSNVSKSSKKGKKVTKSKSAPAKRSTRLQSKGQQETEGETEVKTRKRKMANPVHLAVIPEEDKASVKSSSSEEPQVPEEVPIKRTRKTSKQ